MQVRSLWTCRLFEPLRLGHSHEVHLPGPLRPWWTTVEMMIRLGIEEEVVQTPITEGWPIWGANWEHPVIFALLDPFGC